MNLYSEIIKYNFQKHATYPLEILSSLLKKIVRFLFLLLFWYVVSKNSENIFDFKQLAAYFLISSSIINLTGNHSQFGRNIQKMIKSGEISNYFLKPMETIPFLYSSYLGSWTVSNFYSLITILIGIMIMPPSGFINYAFFLIFLTLSVISTLAINIIIGCLAFYIEEAGSLKNTYEHVYSVFSGATIPLIYFPETIRNLTLLTPLPYLVYTPINALQSKYIDTQILKALIASIIWAAFLTIFSNLAWKRSVKNYEGVGI